MIVDECHFFGRIIWAWEVERQNMYLMSFYRKITQIIHTTIIFILGHKFVEQMAHSICFPVCYLRLSFGCQFKIDQLPHFNVFIPFVHRNFWSYQHECTIEMNEWNGTWIYIEIIYKWGMTMIRITSIKWITQFFFLLSFPLPWLPLSISLSLIIIHIVLSTNLSFVQQQ